MNTLGMISRPSQGKYVTLKSIRNLRSWFKDASVQDVQDVIKQLEHLKKEKLKEAEDFKTHTLRTKYDTFSFACNLDNKSLEFEPQEVLDGLADTLKCSLNRYRSARVKYRYHDLNGNVCEWSGQGREPVKLRQVLKATGKSREDFLIKEDGNHDAFLSNDNLLKLSASIERKQSLFIKN